MPENWAPVSSRALFAAQLAFALIYLSSAVVESIALRRTLSFAEIIQTSFALLIGMGGAIWVFHSYAAGMFAMGLAALTAGIACYAVSFRLFEHDSKWNFRAWSTFGLVLVTAGIALPFSRAAFWILCCTAAAICCWTARSFRLPTLALHGAIYYATAAVIAPGALWISLLLLAAGIAAWIPIDRDGKRNQIASVAIGAQMLWIAAGLFGSPVPLLSAGALALAWAGKRWSRPDFIWLVYGLLVFGAYTLAIRDFREAHNLALVISLVSYGGALILLPKSKN